MIRIRFIYSKQGFIRFTSNLDMQKIWERSIRRAGFSIAYSQGFHPQAKIQQASPLPLGFTGEKEIVDIWFDEDTLDSERIINHLNSKLPDGIKITSQEEIGLSEKTLMQFLHSSFYEITFPGFILSKNIIEIFEQIKNQEVILVVKNNGKKYNAKPRIISQLLSEDNRVLFLELSNQPNFSTRPDHIMIALGFDPAQSLITRKEIKLSYG